MADRAAGLASGFVTINLRNCRSYTAILANRTIPRGAYLMNPMVNRIVLVPTLLFLRLGQCC